MSGAKPKINSVAEYEKSVPDLAYSAWRQLRQAVLTAAPEADELISYQMPALRQNGMVIYYSATSTHVAVSFPSPKIFMDMKKELAPFEVGKTSIKFPLDKPLPIPLIKKIVMYRVEEEQQKARKKKAQRLQRLHEAIKNGVVDMADPSLKAELTAMRARRSTLAAERRWNLSADHCSRNTARSSPGRNSHHGLENRTAMDTCRRCERRIGGCWRSQFCNELARHLRTNLGPPDGVRRADH